MVEDIHGRKSCINLDYISCINPNENSVDIVFSDGAKPTFNGRESSLCSLLTNGHTNFC